MPGGDKELWLKNHKKGKNSSELPNIVILRNESFATRMLADFTSFLQARLVALSHFEVHLSFYLFGSLFLDSDSMLVNVELMT